jgi:AraC-like DNA-binding protein
MRTAPSRIDFHRTKYGREILIDIAWIHEMPTFIHAEPHWLSFFDITLITRGRGWFWLDGHRYRVAPGQVLFTTPGQVRSWDVTSLDGLCLFFPSAFLGEFFSDADFLHRLPYFHATSAAAAVRLAPAARTRLRTRLSRMRTELRAWRPDSAHLLRARLYEVLVRLARTYARAYGTDAERRAHPTVLRFRQLVDRDATKRHDLASIAADIGVSPAHLTRLCRQQLGMTAKEVMQQRLEIAARRLLLFSEQTCAQIAAALGFADASYFARFFRRRTGVTPARFRAGSRGSR